MEAARRTRTPALDEQRRESDVASARVQRSPPRGGLWPTLRTSTPARAGGTKSLQEILAEEREAIADRIVLEVLALGIPNGEGISKKALKTRRLCMSERGRSSSLHEALGRCRPRWHLHSSTLSSSRRSFLMATVLRWRCHCNFIILYCAFAADSCQPNFTRSLSSSSIVDVTCMDAAVNASSISVYGASTVSTLTSHDALAADQSHSTSKSSLSSRSLSVVIAALGTGGDCLQRAVLFATVQGVLHSWISLVPSGTYDT